MASFVMMMVLGLVLAVGTANALKCYSCNSKDNMSCGWGIASFTYNTVECASAGFLDKLVGPKCYKITATNREGTEYIARGCQDPPAFGCSTIASAIGWVSSHSSNDPDAVSDIQCSTCDEDKCNSASKVTGFTLLGLLLASVAFFF